MTKHTPGMAHLVIYGKGTWNDSVRIGSEVLCNVAHPRSGDNAERNANAARIVHTWNCHDELIAALEDALITLRAVASEDDADSEAFRRLSNAEHALKLAKGE